MMLWNECPEKSIYFRSGVHAVKNSGWKQRVRKWGIMLLLAVCMCSFVIYARKSREDLAGQPKQQNVISSFFRRQMERAYFQIPAFLEEGERERTAEEKMAALVLKELPFFYYAQEKADIEPETEDPFTAELILQKEGIDEDFKNIEEENLDYGKDALHIESSMLEELEKENNLHKNEEEEPVRLDEVQLAENGMEFQKASYPVFTYDWSENWDYEGVISNFYAVDSSTLLDEEYTDISKLLYQDLSVDKEKEGPQILIYHTHASESFLDSVEGDPSTTIVGAGDKLARLLQDQYGFQVMHHAGVYDVVREDAYANALPELEKILEENPTIEVVIDLHRDAVSGDRKLVMDLQGRPTARFMFFNGLSYIRKSGKIEYLKNPYIQENLAFSFQAQVAANEYYPGLARKIYLKAYRYNLHLKPKSMLIELGAQNNTVEEIMNACDPLAHILAIVLDDVL